MILKMTIDLMLFFSPSKIVFREEFVTQNKKSQLQPTVTTLNILKREKIAMHID